MTDRERSVNTVYRFVSRVSTRYFVSRLSTMRGAISRSAAQTTAVTGALKNSGLFLASLSI